MHRLMFYILWVWPIPSAMIYLPLFSSLLVCIIQTNDVTLWGLNLININLFVNSCIALYNFNIVWFIAGGFTPFSHCKLLRMVLFDGLLGGSSWSWFLCSIMGRANQNYMCLGRTSLGSLRQLMVTLMGTFVLFFLWFGRWLAVVLFHKSSDLI